MNIPGGTASLFISCADPAQKQFAGIRRLMPLLAAAPAACFLDWPGEVLDLTRRKSLRWVLISGHGSDEEACITGKVSLEPADLRLPAKSLLYLLGCYQGREDLRRTWALSAGLSRQNVHGNEGETESALSTCLLLHLLEDGLDSLERWFAVWVRCNAALAPHFPAIRKLYEENASDALVTWQALRSLPAVQPYLDFVNIAQKYPEYLTGLA